MTSSSKCDIIDYIFMSTKIEIGSYVVCPSHGVGEILSIEKQTYYDIESEFYKIDFKNDKMLNLVPLDRIKEMGIRKVSSKKITNRIIKEILTKQSKTLKGLWTKKVIEYEAKLYSGCLQFVAEVVRDLFPGTKDPNRSYSEKVLYDKAYEKLLHEIRASLEVDEVEANKMIIDALASSFAKKVNIQEKLMEDDKKVFDFNDEDEEEYEEEEDKLA